MKKILKWTAIILMGLAILVVGVGLVIHEPRPEGKSGPEAEALADAVMNAVDCAAWDTTGAVSWRFGDRNDHLWDKDRHYAKVSWGDNNMALVDINAQKGVAFKGGKRVSGEQEAKMVDQAWKNWVNDAFWLNAPCKIKDPGTSRSIVEMEDGRKGLMVTYSSGGATPGDSYLWELDENNRPIFWKMWVSISPVGGVGSSWSGWETLSTGAQVAAIHEMSAFNLKIDNIKAAATLAELVPGEDPFALLEE